jgi:hypothetical protein
VSKQLVGCIQMPKAIGRCRLCGYLKELTKEHIPPHAAFNADGVIFETMQDALGITGRKYSKFPGGIQKTSLCASCNNKTGDWYAKSYVEWAKQGFIWLDKIQANVPLPLVFHIMPLNVLKQIIIMNLATISEQRIDAYEELRGFVLNRQSQYLPPNLRIFVYINRKGGKPRLFDQEGVIGRFDTGDIEFVNSEIALPPFGYCVTSTSTKGTKSFAESQGLYDISWFSDYNFWTAVYPKLCVRETHGPFALDYRSEAEVKEHSMKNL